MLAICKIHEAGIEHNQLLSTVYSSPPISPVDSDFPSPTSTTSWASSTRTLVPTYSCLANSPNSRSRSRSNTPWYAPSGPTRRHSSSTESPPHTSTHIIPQGLSPRIIDFSHAKRRHVCTNATPADAYGRVVVQRDGDGGQGLCPELVEVELMAFDVMGMSRPILPPATRFGTLGSTPRWF